MAGIDNNKPHLAVYPWPVGFDQPDSPNYIPTTELTTSCYGIGNSYHQWRNIRNWTAAAATAEMVVPYMWGNKKYSVLEKQIVAFTLMTGVFITAEVFTKIRDRQFKECADNVGKEVDRRHKAEVASKTDAAFWATTPFQVMGTMQALGRDLDTAAQSPLVTPVIGAAAFAALAAGAVYQLRFGNTAPLQHLVESF